MKDLFEGWAGLGIMIAVVIGLTGSTTLAFGYIGLLMGVALIGLLVLLFAD